MRTQMGSFVWLMSVAAVALFAWQSEAVAADGLPFTTYYSRDVFGRTVGVVQPDPDGTGGLPYLATRHTYNPDGYLILTEVGTSTGVSDADLAAMVALQKIEMTHDAAGRPLKAVRSGRGNGASAWVVSEVTQYSYDLAGRLECTAVRMNPAVYASLPASACAPGTSGTYGPDRIVRNSHDVAGRLLQVQKAYGTSVQQNYATYTYTIKGQMETAKDANGNLSTFTYDGFDRRDKWIFPSKTAPGQSAATDYEQYGYDPNSNRTSLRKRDGQTFSYSYDALNRMTLKDAPGSTSDVYYTYDLLSRQTAARLGSSAGGGVISGYDGAGRLTSSANFGRALNYTYDANGNRKQLMWPDGSYVSYGYDGLDRMTSIAEGASNTSLAGITYDALSRRSAINYGSSVSSTVFGYDPASRLTSLTHNLAGAVGQNTDAFTYNPASQVVSRASSSNTYTYTGHANFSRSYAANGLNQYTQAGSVNFSYDANGNLTSDGQTTFGYDAENRLTTASGARSASLTYDPMGRLRTYTSGSASSELLYDGDALVAEYRDGVLARRYVHGPGIDEPLVWYEGSTRRYLYANHQGSAVAVSDSTGNVLAINSYDVYGIPSAANLGRFGYTGQIHLSELGLWHYKARVYDPGLGRFLQTDPIGYDDDFDLYAYVGNDPLNKTDPRGKDARIVVWGNGRVEITVPIYFKGAAATTQNVGTIVSNIESTFTGKFGAYDVTTKVELLSQNDLSTAFVTNEIEIVNGATDGNLGHSYVRDGAEGTWTMDDINSKPIPTGVPGQMAVGTKGANTAAHEAAHLMGLPDEKGQNNGRLMDDSSGARVDGADITRAIEHPNNSVSQCTGDTGDCKR